MTPLTTENLELKFEDNIAFMSVNGQVTKETMAAAYDWFGTLAEDNDNINICVDMAKADFPDLSAVSTQFRNVSNAIRLVPGADKCAVLSDSAFVRNSAKVEGAVIPGLDLQTFKLGQSEPAGKWLRDEPLLEDTPKTAEAVESIEAAQPTPPAPSTKKWDNLDLTKVDF